jgi:hypothetical protein
MLDDEQIKEDLETAMRQQVAGNDKLQLWEGMCQNENEPDFEALKRHFEVWVSTHPYEAKEFMDYRKEVTDANLKDTGADKSNSIRRAGDMPLSLYTLFSILAPNFLGGQEISPDKRKKRLHTFLKEFPIFQTAKKL